MVEPRIHTPFGGTLDAGILFANQPSKGRYLILGIGLIIPTPY